METPRFQFSLKNTLSRLKFGGGESMSADLLWQLILGGSVVGIAVIMTFAYITYDWAMSTDLSTAPTQKVRDTLSVAELENVIAIYKNKEDESSKLLRNPPRAPEYRKGHGITVTPSSVMGSTTPQDGATSSPR